MGKFYDSILLKLQEIISGLGGPDKAVDHLPWSRATLYRITKGKLPKTETVFEWLESWNAKIAFPDERPADNTREVCFVDAKMVGANGGKPEQEDYLAVPLAAGPVAAGPGLIPQDEVKGWVLVWRHHRSISGSKLNLVAVEIGRDQISMVPRLHPGDIVLVNKDRRTIDHPGRMYLVRDPEDSVKVKRVSVELKGGHTWIVFSSDNPEYRPELYSLEADYGGDGERPIIGQVVWAWSDMTMK